MPGNCQKRLTKEFDEASEVVDGLNARLAVLGYTLATGGNSVSKSTKNAGDAFGDLRDQVREAQGALDAFRQGGEEELERYQQYAEELDLATRAFEKYKDEVNDGSKTFEDFRVLAQELGQATRDLSDEQEDAATAAAEFAKAQAEAAKETEKALREYEKVVEGIGRISQEKLGDILYKSWKEEHFDFIEFFKDTTIRAFADIAAAALTQQIVMPIAVQAVGAVPGLFGLSGQAAQTASSAAGGGGIFDIFNTGSSLVNIFGGGASNLASSFAGSSIGAAFGLSTSAAPTLIAGAQSGLAIGGYGGVAAGAAGTGSALTGAGSALVAAAPYIAAAAAVAIPILFASGAFQGPPSVGPTGVAITSNVLGDGLPDMITGTDNGGDATAAAQALEGISNAALEIEDNLTGAVRRTDRSFGLDVSYYPNPESGSRSAGFGLNEIIDGVKNELDIAGLTGEEVLAEGVIRTLRGAFETLGDGRIDTALENTAAESIETLLEDLSIAQTIADHMNGTVEAPLTAVELQFEALTDRAEEFEKKAVALGLSLQEAELVTESWTQALSDSVAGDFESRINASTGNGFLNTVGDLIEQRNVDGRNAEAAGLDVDGTAGVLFRSLLGGFVGDLDQAQRDLIRATFSDDQGVLDVLDRADAEGLLAQSFEVANENMRERLDLLDDERNELERLADVAGNLGANLRNAANGLLTNQSLSRLSLEEQLAEARRQTEAAFAIANDNTPMDDESVAAAGRLPELVRTTLELSRAFNASNEDYLDDFTRGQEILNSTADRALSIEAQQLSSIQLIDAEMHTLNDNLAANDNASGIDFGANPAVNRQIYDALSAAGIGISGFGQGQLNQLRQTNSQANQIVSALGFADGGVVGGGIPGVDSVSAMLMPGERVLTVEQNRIFDRLSSDMGGGMVVAIRSLQGEVAGLRADNARLQSQLVRVTAGGSIEVTKAVQEGNSQRGRMLDDRMVDRAAPMPRKVA
jgi:hypothetical protein